MYPLDLKDCLRKHAFDKTHLGLRAVLHMASRLCAAISFTHSRKVLHRDLKPRNILLRRDEVQPAANRTRSLRDRETFWCPVVCDFGNACHIDAHGLRWPSRKYCTLQYCAPEVLLPLMRYCWPSDVWSLGLVLAEVEHLFPVAMGSSPAQSSIEQLLILWRLCQPAAASPTSHPQSFAQRAKRELASYPEVALLTPLAHNSPHPTLGRVYGLVFTTIIKMLLKFDPAERGALNDVHDLCIQRLQEVRGGCVGT